MNIKQKSLQFGILSLLVLFLMVGSTSADQNLTSAEAVNLTLQDAQVADWITDRQYTYDEPWLDYNSMWHITFVDSDTGDRLSVTVDDYYKKVVGIYEYKGYNYDWEPRYDETTINTAIDYVKNAAILSDFVQNNPEAYWGGSGYSENIQIWASGEYSENYQWLNIEVQVVDDTTFSIYRITSNVAFGDAVHDFDYIEAVHDSNAMVTEFKAHYSEFYTNSHLILDNSTGDNSYQFSTTYSGYSSTSSDEGFAYCGEYGWLQVITDDASEEIIDLQGTPTNTRSETEILQVLEDHPSFGSWMSSVSDLTPHSYFNGRDSWYVSFYSETSNDYGYATVNDTSGQVEDFYYFIPIPAELSEDEAKTVALDLPKVKEWSEKVDNYEINTWYNDRGTWSIYLQDPIIYQNSINIQVDDQSGTAIVLYSSYADPNLELNEVYQIIADEGVSEFLDEYPDARVSIHYSGSYETQEYYDEKEAVQTGDVSEEEGASSEPGYYGMEDSWYVYIYSPTFVEASIYMRINDTSEEVVEKTENSPEFPAQHTVDEIKELVEQEDLYIEYTDDVEIETTYLSFYRGTWYFYASGTDDTGASWLWMSIDDTTYNVTEASIYAPGCYGPYYAEDMVALEGDQPDVSTMMRGEQDTVAEVESLLSNLQPQGQGTGIPLQDVLDQANSSHKYDLDFLSFTPIFLVTILIPVVRRKFIK